MLGSGDVKVFLNGLRQLAPGVAEEFEITEDGEKRPCYGLCVGEFCFLGFFCFLFLFFLRQGVIM